MTTRSSNTLQSTAGRSRSNTEEHSTEIHGIEGHGVSWCLGKEKQYSIAILVETLIRSRKEWKPDRKLNFVNQAGFSIRLSSVMPPSCTGQIVLMTTRPSPALLRSHAMRSIISQTKSPIGFMQNRRCDSMPLTPGNTISQTHNQCRG